MTTLSTRKAVEISTNKDAYNLIEPATNIDKR